VTWLIWMAASLHVAAYGVPLIAGVLALLAVSGLLCAGRLHGLGRREALERGARRLRDVGLSDAGAQRVGTYSHGMQKRLAMARALIMDPPVLVVDEATDGLDPEGSRRIQDLVSSIATPTGTAVVWTTQRLDEIRGFANAVTVLDQGATAFQGTVEELMLRSTSRVYIVRLVAAGGAQLGQAEIDRIGAALPGARLERSEDDREHFRLELGRQAVLGDVLGAIAAAGASVLDCAQQRSELEESFLRLTTART
jgi:ABC-2 type transport system ATP-binding protein